MTLTTSLGEFSYYQNTSLLYSSYTRIAGDLSLQFTDDVFMYTLSNDNPIGKVSTLSAQMYSYESWYATSPNMSIDGAYAFSYSQDSYGQWTSSVALNNVKNNFFSPANSIVLPMAETVAIINLFCINYPTNNVCCEPPTLGADPLY